jgi:dTDP-4-dehydrorhamnose reductase
MEITEARWHIAGGYGMLATDIIAALRARGVEPVVTDRDDLDITNPAQVARGFADADVVVNCAAYTAVDAAEEDEAAAFAVNATGPGVIARACAEMGLRMVHLSTDYVFAGDATTPYAEDSPFGPKGAYGRTKAAGETQVRDSGADALIVRTAWLYGRGGPCFPKTIARLGRERGALQVVDDQVGQPTWTRDLADLVLRLVEAEAPAGTYHGTSSGQTSWYEFAKEVVASAGLGDIVTPSCAADQKRPAPRPAYSVLCHDALSAIGVAPIGDWRERWRLAAPEVLADVAG